MYSCRHSNIFNSIYLTVTILHVRFLWKLCLLVYIKFISVWLCRKLNLQAHSRTILVWKQLCIQNKMRFFPPTIDAHRTNCTLIIHKAFYKPGHSLLNINNHMVFCYDNRESQLMAAPINSKRKSWILLNSAWSLINMQGHNEANIILCFF